MKTVLLLPLLLSSLSAYAQFQPSKARSQPGVIDPENWMAIVGDSGTTGAVASPRLKATLRRLGGKAIRYLTVGHQEFPEFSLLPNPDYYRITNPIERLTRITYSMNEYAEAVKENRVRPLNRDGETAQILDIPEYSFGYFVGRRLGIMGTDIVMVAQDGKRVDSIAEQFRRLEVLKEPTLPPLILVSFTANDLCDEGIFTDSVESRAQRFEHELRRQFGLVFERHKPHRIGTHIVVLAPIDVANVLTNPKILAQKIKFQGMGRIQCSSLRQGPIAEGFLSERTRRALTNSCTAVLNTSLGQKDRIVRIVAVQTAFGEAWKKVLAEWQAGSAPAGMKFSYLESIRQIDFETGDVGNDCFHPGIGAHMKIADKVLQLLE